MNREDIIRMAREATKEAPREDWNSTAWVFGDETLERFAALVASVEREAIAQMIEDAPALMEFAQNDQGGCLMCGFTPRLAAKTIRSRGQT